MKSKNAFISTENLPLVLSIPELACVLNISLNTAYKLVSSGQIRARRIGRRIRIPRAAVLEYLDAAS